MDWMGDLKRGARAAALATVGFTVLAGGRPGAAQEEPDPCVGAGVAPYVFLLFDTSGSLEWAPVCTTAQLATGVCSQLCPTGDCRAPSHGDDPASKFYQLKEGLYTSLDHQYGLQFGFASFNQDSLRVRAKHWRYQAAGDGPTVPGWGPFPAAGTTEVFGTTWTCATGSGDGQLGCAGSTPASLSDSWAVARLHELPKGGALLNQSVVVYVRQAGVTYRVIYAPVPGGALGGPLQANVTVSRCTNAPCSVVTQPVQQTVSFTPVQEFLAEEFAASTPNRLAPQMSFFTDSVATQTTASNTCSGWDPNTDTTADRYSGYSLRFPTTSDPRGSAYSSGDVFPLDWTADHRFDIQARLAPSVLLGADPDFRMAPYLQDRPLGSETWLRLKNEQARPLFVSGSTPHGGALQSFKTWWASWSAVARFGDPLWACRTTHVVLLTDGEDTCSVPTGGPNACTVAGDLRNLGITTHVLAYGTPTSFASLDCIAQNGGSTAVLYPGSPVKLNSALDDLFDTIRGWPVP